MLEIVHGLLTNKTSRVSNNWNNNYGLEKNITINYANYGKLIVEEMLGN